LNAEDIGFREGNGGINSMCETVTFEPKSLAELNKFLEENKDRYHEIWVIITNKKSANPQVISFDQVVSEAKKQGLIDSRIKNMDEKRYMIRLTKRINPKP
jgi:arginine utilization protein RocB